MKRFICTLIVVLFIAPAYAEGFQDDFNSRMEEYGVEKLKYFESDGEAFYMSGFIFVSDDEESITVIGEDPLKTIAVACCAFSIIDKKETKNELAGRVLMTYFELNGSESAYSFLSGYPIVEQINEGMLVIMMAK